MNKGGRSALHLAPFVLLAAINLIISGCGVITVKPDASAQPSREPDYEQSIPYLFFGLYGTEHFDVESICFGREAEKIQSVHTLMDLSVGMKSLFFYFPKTAKIWCKQEYPETGIGDMETVMKTH